VRYGEKKTVKEREGAPTECREHSRKGRNEIFVKAKAKQRVFKGVIRILGKKSKT